MKSDMGAACSTYAGRGEGGVYGVLVGKSEGKRKLRRRLRWEDNIKMDLPEIGLGGLDWIGRPEDMDRWRAVVSAVTNCSLGSFWTC